MSIVAGSDKSLRRGFTLIELLVVISIIALLISILLPSLSKARSSADRMKCLSIQRQMGMANEIYANEQKDWYVPICMNYSAPANQVWWSGNNDFRRLIKLKESSGASSWPVNDWPVSLTCPAASYALQEGIETRVWRTYGFNSEMRRPWSIWMGATPPVAMAYRRPQLLRTSQGMQAADAVDIHFNWDGSKTYVGETPTGGSIAYRHNSSINILYFDGHAGNRKNSEMYQIPRSDFLWSVTRSSTP